MRFLSFESHRELKLYDLGRRPSILWRDVLFFFIIEVLENYFIGIELLSLGDDIRTKNDKTKNFLKRYYLIEIDLD